MFIISFYCPKKAVSIGVTDTIPMTNLDYSFHKSNKKRKKVHNLMKKSGENVAFMPFYVDFS